MLLQNASGLNDSQFEEPTMIFFTNPRLDKGLGTILRENLHLQLHVRGLWFKLALLMFEKIAFTFSKQSLRTNFAQFHKDGDN